MGEDAPLKNAYAPPRGEDSSLHGPLGPRHRFGEVGDGLRGILGLFLGSTVFATAAQATLGGSASSRGELLALLVGQQLIVVLGLALWFARLDRLRYEDVAGELLRPAAWLLAAFLGAGGAVLLQSPLLEAWAAARGYVAPGWWAVVVNLDGFLPALTTIGAICLLPALAEEVFFRGYLQPRFSALGAAGAIVLQAILFATFHADLYGLPIYLVSGLLLGALRYWSGSIWPGVLAHFTNNLVGVIEISSGVSIYSELGVFGLPLGGLLVAAAVAVIRLPRGRGVPSGQ